MIILHQALLAVSGSDEALEWLRNNARRDGRSTIIACDFDGTLCHSDYPTIISPNEPLLKAVRMMREMGYEIILWTCRELDMLEMAMDWLAEQGLSNLRANDNSEAIKELFGGYNSRKIFADEYWDDKAICAAWQEE